MKLTELKVGSRLELEVNNNLGKKVGNSLISEFEWAEDEKIAYIAAPIRDGAIYPIHTGSMINIYFIQNYDDYMKMELYKFRASVLERTKKDTIALLKIKLVDGFEKIQRRQYFRIKCLLPLKYRVVNQNENGSIEKSEFKNAVTRDISGGGLCIAAEESIEINKILEFELLLNNEINIKFLGKVVRISRIYGDQKYKHEVGLCFEKISDKDREEIIRFIFFEQRKLRQRGLV